MRTIPLLAIGGALGATIAAIGFLNSESDTDALRPSPVTVLRRDVAGTDAVRSQGPQSIQMAEGQAERSSAQEISQYGTNGDAGHASSGPNASDGSNVAASAIAARRVSDHDLDTRPEETTQIDTMHPRTPGSQIKHEAVTTFPDDAEAKIWQVLSANQHLGFTSIDRVVCQPTICEIRFTGGPDLSNSEGILSLLLPLSSALPMIKSGMMSSRHELSPGVFTSVFTMRSYIGNELLEKPQGR